MIRVNFFIINDFIETTNHLFILYTQNAPSPKSARKGELFYNACIYDKAKKELFHIYMDKAPFVPEGGRWPQKPKNFMKNNYDHETPMTREFIHDFLLELRTAYNPRSVRTNRSRQTTPDSLQFDYTNYPPDGHSKL